MNLKDAVNSGKPFRYKNWKTWETVKSFKKWIEEEENDMTLEWIISDDWEIQRKEEEMGMFEFFSYCDCPYCDEFNSRITVRYSQSMEPVTTERSCEHCGKTFQVTPDQIDEVECQSDKMPKKKAR